jgi:hypothetical protein
MYRTYGRLLVGASSVGHGIPLSLLLLAWEKQPPPLPFFLCDKSFSKSVQMGLYKPTLRQASHWTPNSKWFQVSDCKLDGNTTNNSVITCALTLLLLCRLMFDRGQLADHFDILHVWCPMYACGAVPCAALLGLSERSNLRHPPGTPRRASTTSTRVTSTMSMFTDLYCAVVNASHDNP